MAGRARMSSTFGPTDSTGMRVRGGVAGIADVSSTMGGTSGMTSGRSAWLDPSGPAFWTLAMYLGAWGWLLWVRFIFRGGSTL